MKVKPATSDGYERGFTEAVRSTCLYLATILGDYLDDIVIVGGLVPSLIVNQDQLPAGADAHAGTLDLDVGLALTVLDDARYSAIAERLNGHGFKPARKASGDGKGEKFRWVLQLDGCPKVTIDFLIPCAGPGKQGRTLHELEPGFAAIIAPALELAFLDFMMIDMSGTTILGERATRTMKVCGPAAFVVMKAHAFRSRGENKDAYDLFYVLRNFGSGPGTVAERFQALRHHSTATEALNILSDDFAAEELIGPHRVARFSTITAPELRAEVATFVLEFLRLVSTGYEPRDR